MGRATAETARYLYCEIRCEHGNAVKSLAYNPDHFHALRDVLHVVSSLVEDLVRHNHSVQRLKLARPLVAGAMDQFLPVPGQCLAGRRLPGPVGFAYDHRKRT